MLGYFYKQSPLLFFLILCLVVFIFLLYMGQVTHHRNHVTGAISVCIPDKEKDIEDFPEIPDFMFTHIHNMAKNDRFMLPTCASSGKVMNFVYAKTHKCASDTLAAMCRRFAVTRNLSVVTPVLDKFLLGWPHSFQYFMHRPAKHAVGYNVLLDHMVFNYNYISSIMPKDTVYFTSIREPFARLGSALVYHGMKKCGRMPDGDIVQEFLDHMILYDDLYKSSDNTLNLTGCKCIPKGLSIARNAMAFDLGFPTGWNMFTSDQQNNNTYILEWLRDVHQTFHVILLVERFNESLVLLKRFMCWGFKDILFRTLRVSKRPKDIQYDQEQMDTFRRWNNVDTLLHYMASKVFSIRVSNLGSDFQDEVSEYVQQETLVLDYCQYKTKQNRNLSVSSTKWGSGYTFTHEDCQLLMDKSHLRDLVKEQYNLLNGHDHHDFPLKEGYNMATYC